MEEQIENLIRLGRRYVSHANAENQPDGIQEYGDARVHLFGDKYTVEFDREKIEIDYFGGSIKLPIDAHVLYLQAIYEDAKNYLEKLKK